VSDVTYLDHAATSAIRPRAVTDAMVSYMENVGATPGRSAHRLSVEAGRIALRCRQRLAELLDIPGDSARIAFMANATQALNTALAGTLQPGDRVVVSALDHNAVLRPVALLARRGVDVVMIGADASGRIDEDALLPALEGARLLCINAASNVLGTAADVTYLATLARNAGARTLVDVAQVAGHAPFSAANAGVDMVAFTGHKGMLGPQGIGGLWVREDVEVEPLLAGGSGGDSLQRDMPRALPDRLEAGTLNGPGIAGLLAGVEHVLNEGVAVMHARIGALKLQLHAQLSQLEHVRVLSPADGGSGVGIVTIVSDVVDPATLAHRLDREHGVLVRAGLHCAPETHRLLGSDRTGAVRFSLGWSSTPDDVQRAVHAVASVVGSRTIVA